MLVDRNITKPFYRAQNCYSQNKKATQYVALNNVSVAKIRTEYRHQMNQNQPLEVHYVAVLVAGYIAVLALD